MIGSLVEETTSNNRISIGDRRFASDVAKNRLQQLELIEKRIQASRQEFVQLAIASRLKSEFDSNVCESERRKPISCRLNWRQLSNGRLLILELINRLPAASLIDWTVLIQILPLTSADHRGDDVPKRRRIGISSCSTYVRPLARLDAGASVALEIYWKRDDEIDTANFAKPVGVRCHLSRYFPNSLDESHCDESSGNTLTFCISASILAASDLVYDRLDPTFTLANDSPLIARRNIETDIGEFRFCVTKSLLRLLFPSAIDARRKFVEWLFPQVQNWNWPSTSVNGNNPSKPNSSILLCPTLTMSADVAVNCSIQDRSKTDDYLVCVELTSIKNQSMGLLINLKIAMWIKIMLAIQRLQKYPTGVRLDVTAFFDQADFDFFTSKLPFA